MVRARSSADPRRRSLTRAIALFRPVGPYTTNAISGSAAMIKLVAAGFASAISFVLFGASAVLADRTPPSTGAPTFKLASEIGPSRGGPSGLPHGYLPLHAHEYALAKAAANARAGLGTNRPPKPKPGGG